MERFKVDCHGTGRISDGDNPSVTFHRNAVRTAGIVVRDADSVVIQLPPNVPQEPPAVVLFRDATGREFRYVPEPAG